MAAKTLLRGAGVIGAIVGAFLAGHVAMQPVFAQAAAPAAEAAADPAAADPAAADPVAADPAADPAGDASEAEVLKAQATLPQEDAHKAALAQYPGGSIASTIFGDENGLVVYEMQVFDAAGARHKVKIDANTGAVVHAPDD